MKKCSVFASAALVERAISNAAKYPWAAEIQRQVIDDARPWMELSDEHLRGLMFGPTIKRSWMVWSNGFCPACHAGVPMYNWKHDALARPWKMRCPHCREDFPKNDFGAYYGSGLDSRGVFDPALVDRNLLYNAEHPDPRDSLHQFGVDDGEGYFDGRDRWRFIGAYLIYGQWKHAIVGGIKRLSAAYAATGDVAYAHKAGVMLDRVADLYSEFDFAAQGLVYEHQAHAGYISTWHDACWEALDLVTGYDLAFDGLRASEPDFDRMQAKIEERIFRDTLANRVKISSNFPQTEITIAVTETVLGWPENRESVIESLDIVLERAFMVDGVTGEKGLDGYAKLSPRAMGKFLELYSRADPSFLKSVLRRHPRLRDSYRFHIDTRCLGKYYPTCGDSGSFAAPCDGYAGLAFSKTPGVEPSMYSFLMKLHELTGDPAFAQVLYRENGSTLEGLPHDLFADDPAALQSAVQKVIEREGEQIRLGSVNEQQWHLAILRSGERERERAAWLLYDTRGGHGHASGMNLGLYAKGLDLLPDFGYPPVQFGGWDSPRADWYRMTAAHNTVVVDGAKQPNAQGETVLWIDEPGLHAIAASSPGMIGGDRYERTIAMVDISESDSYLVDVFRVVGGREHVKFTHCTFSQMTPIGLDLRGCADYGYGTLMRDFREDPLPSPGWGVDWTVEDRHKLREPGADVRLRYVDLTSDAVAMTAKAWVTIGTWTSTEDAWMPVVAVRRRAIEEPLESTFVSVLEPYESKSNIVCIRRLLLHTPEGCLCPDSDVAIEIELVGDRRDLLIFSDRAVCQQDWGLSFDSPLCVVRRDDHGNEISALRVSRDGRVEYR